LAGGFARTRWKLIALPDSLAGIRGWDPHRGRKGGERKEERTRRERKGRPHFSKGITTTAVNGSC